MGAKMRWLRDHGQSERYIHVTPDGWNSRLDAIQAAVLDIKLKHLDQWNAARRQAAARYREALGGLPLMLPHEPEYAEAVYHLYVVRAADREFLRRELGSRGIGTGLHYPVPLHLQQAYKHLGHTPSAFPNAVESAATILSLPMHQSLTQAHTEKVARACREILVAVPA
jgi:dTDP-4-amino-4,6-dideoxygalactose transaminase